MTPEDIANYEIDISELPRPLVEGMAREFGQELTDDHFTVNYS